MDSLFSPETIEQLIELLKEATDGGVTVIILWLLIPLVQTLIYVCGWVSAIFIVYKTIRYYLTKMSEHKLEEIKARNKPVQFKLDNKTISEEVAINLRSVILDLIDESPSSYIHQSHVNKLKEVVEQCKAKNQKPNPRY